MQRKHNKKLVSLAKNLRNNMTKEERHLWYDFLRNYPLKFTRQKIIGNYIVDFYCAKAKIVIELDGSQHYSDESMQNAALRSEFLKLYGLTVLRISNLEILKNFNGVCEYVDLVVKQSLSR